MSVRGRLILVGLVAFGAGWLLWASGNADNKESRSAAALCSFEVAATGVGQGCAPASTPGQGKVTGGIAVMAVGGLALAGAFVVGARATSGA